MALSRGVAIQEMYILCAAWEQLRKEGLCSMNIGLAQGLALVSVRSHLFPHTLDLRRSGCQPWEFGLEIWINGGPFVWHAPGPGFHFKQHKREILARPDDTHRPLEVEAEGSKLAGTMCKTTKAGEIILGRRVTVSVLS